MNIFGRSKEKEKSKKGWQVFEAMAIGNRCLKNSRPAEALSHYQTALNAAVAVGDRADEKTLLTLIGQSYLMLNKPNEALDFFGRALVLASELGDADFAETIGTYIDVAKAQRST